MTPTWIVMVLALLPVSSGGQHQAPAIVFENPVREFGTVTEGEILNHVFVFTNEGKGPLEILRMQPSCGCTSVLLSQKEVAPGQSGQIKVSLHTRGLFGRLTKEVVVVTNDPDQPQVRLKLQISVEPELGISERSVFFGTIPKGHGATKEIVISIPPEKSIEILGVTSTDQNFTVELEPVPGAAGKKVKLVITQSPEAGEGYHFGSVVIRTSSSLNPQILIPVRGFVKATVGGSR